MNSKPIEIEWMCNLPIKKLYIVINNYIFISYEIVLL